MSKCGDPECKDDGRRPSHAEYRFTVGQLPYGVDINAPCWPAREREANDDGVKRDD